MKAIDVVKPACPNGHQHQHLRKVFNAFPNAFISDHVCMLKIDHPHICEARIIIESEGLKCSSGSTNIGYPKAYIGGFISSAAARKAII